MTYSSGGCTPLVEMCKLLKFLKEFNSFNASFPVKLSLHEWRSLARNNLEMWVWQDPKSLLKDENNFEGGQGRAGIGVYRKRELLLLSYGLPQIYTHGSRARSSALWPGLLSACSWKQRQRAAERGLTFQTSGGRLQSFHPENTVM